MLDIAALKLLSDLFIEIANAVKRTQKSPKQELARELLTLFDTLDKIQNETNYVTTNLIAFTNEETIGMRVHYIHRAGQHLSKLEEIIPVFLSWLERNTHWQGLLEVFAPKAKEDLLELQSSEISLSVYYSRSYQSSLKQLASRLQAVRSPNPKEFSSDKEVIEIINYLNEISRTNNEARASIRKFASEHLSLDDFFG